MLDQTEKQIAKVEKLFELISEEYLKPQDAEVIFEAILKVIKDTKDELEAKMATDSDQNDKEKVYLKDKIDQMESMCNDMMAKYNDKLTQNLNTVKTEILTKVNEVESKIPLETDLSSIESRLTILETPEAEIEEIDSPFEERDALEALKGDERLDKSAVKGIDEELQRLDKKINDKPTGSVVGGAKGIQIQVAGKKQQLTSQAINFIAGTNVTITTTMVAGVPTLSFSSSGASANQSNNETPSGTIDGANNVFTLAHTPSPASTLKLYLNGAFQASGGEDYTLVTATITFVNAPVSGSIIRAFYDY